MLSDSRLKEQTSSFMQSLFHISDEVITFCFSSLEPTNLFKIKAHHIELYNFVFENCTSKPSHDEKMLELYKTALQKHLIKHREILIRSAEEDKQIATYNKTWESYLSYMNFLGKRVFSYLNRYFLPANGDDSLANIGMNVFISTLLTEHFMKLIVASYSYNVSQIRKNKIINSNDLLKFTESMAILSNDKLFSIIREIYLAQALRYYRDMFDTHCNSEPIVYFNMVANLKLFEDVLASKSICFTTNEKENLSKIFNTELVKKYTHIFCHQPFGFSNMLKNHKTNDLKLVCEVYEKLEGFSELKVFLHDFIMEDGERMLGETSHNCTSDEFVSVCYEFIVGYSKLIQEGFYKITDIHNSFKSAIEKLLIKYDRITEDLFKLTRNSLDSGNFDFVSERIINLFEKLPYKDEYLNLYKNSLEKKIISGSLIYLIEKNFITTMNKICGNKLTSDLDEILEDYIESMPKSINILEDNFNVKILSLHYWEKKFEDQTSLNLTLVEPLLSTWERFQQNYVVYFPKRKLILLPYETKMTLKIYFNQKETTIKCSLIQACIILFVANQTHKIREENFITSLTIEKTFLHRFLEESRALILENENNEYTFNWNFETIDDLVDLDSKVEEEKKVTRHIKQDREIMIQCAIVKVMKKMSKLQFEELVFEVSKEIKMFKPHPTIIKAGVEALKKKEFVEELEDGILLYRE